MNFFSHLSLVYCSSIEGLVFCGGLGFFFLIHLG